MILEAYRQARVRTEKARRTKDNSGRDVHGVVRKPTVAMDALSPAYIHVQVKVRVLRIARTIHVLGFFAQNFNIQIKIGSRVIHPYSHAVLHRIRSQNLLCLW